MDTSESKERDSSKRSIDGFVFDHYFLDKRLAHGGMAEVFLGRDMELKDSAERCVVKCILPDLAGDPQFLAMFLNEAQLAAQMEHPNVVKVLDFGEHDGLLYMAMEYVDGLDCRRFSKRIFPFGEDHAAVVSLIVTQILDALAYVHDMRDVNGRPLRVIHRDLSPSNIYLSRGGHAKLGDFGIARIDSSRYRQISYIPRGKFGYVAPEQIEGGEIDARADIFAMGIVFAELLIGKRLFKGPSRLSVLLEIRDGRFQTLEQSEDRIEPGLLGILRKAMSLAPQDRFQSAENFRDAVVRYMGGRLDCISSLSGLVAFAADEEERARFRSDAALPLGKRDDTSPSPSRSRSLSPSMAPTDPRRITPSFWRSYRDDDDASDPTPVTLNFDPEKRWRYTVQFKDKRIEASVSFARVMELIYQDEITSDTMVSVNDGPFLSADQYPELFRHIPVYTPTMDLNDVKHPDRRGVFTVEAPSEVVLSLASAGETGLWVCKKDKDRKEVYFRNGAPVYASSNNARELLGEYLVSRGVIDRGELETALEILPKFDGHMGDTLIALGMVSAMDLFRAISDQIRFRFSDLLTWRQGIYEFYRDVTCRQNAPEIPIEPYAYLSDRLSALAADLNHADVMKAAAPGVVAPSALAGELLDRMTLPDNIISILKDVESPVSVGALLNRFDEAACAAALYVGTETGIWTFDGASLLWR